MVLRVLHDFFYFQGEPRFCKPYRAIGSIKRTLATLFPPVRWSTTKRNPVRYTSSIFFPPQISSLYYKIITVKSFFGYSFILSRKSISWFSCAGSPKSYRKEIMPLTSHVEIQTWILVSCPLQKFIGNQNLYMTIYIVH